MATESVDDPIKRMKTDRRIARFMDKHRRLYHRSMRHDVATIAYEFYLEGYNNGLGQHPIPDAQLAERECARKVLEGRIEEIHYAQRLIGDEYMERIGDPLVDGHTAAREQDRQFTHKMLRDRLAELRAAIEEVGQKRKDGAE